MTEDLVQTKHLIIGIILGVTSWTSHLIFSTVGERTQASTPFSLTRANRSTAIFSPFCFYLQYSLLVACRLLTQYLLNLFQDVVKLSLSPILNFERKKKNHFVTAKWVTEVENQESLCLCLCLCVCGVGGVDPITLGCPWARHLINSCSGAAESCSCGGRLPDGCATAQVWVDEKIKLLCREN